MCFSVTAYAADNSGGDTKIDTVVPSSHTITVIITGKGGVLKDGADISGSITVARHGDVTLTLTPDTGFVLSKVIYNGEDITNTALSGSIMLSNIRGNGTLKVVFIADTNDKGNSPETGDNSNLFIPLAIMTVSMGGILLTVKKRKHRCVKN